MPFQSKINSLDWCSHPWKASGVGEVWGATRPYNGAKPLPYAVGLEPCKPPTVFQEGETLDPDAPPQVYNADQFPACCLNQWIPQGGIAWGGAATVIDPNAVTLNVFGTCELAIANVANQLEIGKSYSLTCGFLGNWHHVVKTPAGTWRVVILSVSQTGNEARFISGGCFPGTLEWTATAAGQFSPVFGPDADVILIDGRLIVGTPAIFKFGVLPG